MQHQDTIREHVIYWARRIIDLIIVISKYCMTMVQRATNNYNTQYSRAGGASNSHVGGSNNSQSLVNKTMSKWDICILAIHIYTHIQQKLTHTPALSSGNNVQVSSLIAEGGFSFVYKASLSSNGTLVAVKQIITFDR